ncbi:hypothetical protein PspLS_06254 [Pyricularia sp. CBS 133598]|nr:hypothetical protein PspLS_06254 [Pyricularia sp. CBS 133598]
MAEVRSHGTAKVACRGLRGGCTSLRGRLLSTVRIRNAMRCFQVNSFLQIT